MLILHSYWLSLAAYRVRIALRLKGVPFEERTHDLGQGQQHAAAFLAVNPAGAVPALEGGTPEPLTQSLAIIEWLDDTYPAAPLLPADAAGRAKVRALFLLTAADTHPLIVPRVRKQLAERFGADEKAVADWAAHWFRQGLANYEALLPQGATRCHAEALTIADLALAQPPDRRGAFSRGAGCVSARGGDRRVADGGARNCCGTSGSADRRPEALSRCISWWRPGCSTTHAHALFQCSRWCVAAFAARQPIPFFMNEKCL